MVHSHTTAFTVDATGNLSIGNGALSITNAGKMTVGETNFNLDENGNMWLGASTMAAAPFSVTNSGYLTATSGIIAGFYINSTDMTIYQYNADTGKNDIIIGFISKGSQQGYYQVGSSGLKQNWFLWNRGLNKQEVSQDGVTGLKGVFGVDVYGQLYAVQVHRERQVYRSLRGVRRQLQLRVYQRVRIRKIRRIEI